jgi:SAM-dependent methyltransferase
MLVGLKKQLKRIKFIRNLGSYLDNRLEINDFVFKTLQKLSSGDIVLDAGCGDQPYRNMCSHLIYRSQDFGKYTSDTKETIHGGRGLHGDEDYRYGQLDYTGDIWKIAEVDAYFDAIICTEVFEHIPYPSETIREFSRLLKPGGKLIITAPSNCLRHMDPYFFYSGFSDRWYEHFLAEFDFVIEEMHPVGDYYRWIGVEIKRTMSNHSLLAKIFLFPTFLYFYFKKKSETSINTLCLGYHVVAKKQNI